MQKRVNKIKKNIGDSVIVKKRRKYNQRLSELHEVTKNNCDKNIQFLLLGGERTEFFVTEDSRKYILEKQQCENDIKCEYVDSRGYFDSLHVRYIKTYSARELQQKHIVSEFRNVKNITSSFRMALKLDMSPLRMWQVSLAGAVLFGMVSMSMIYRNLGQNAFAKTAENTINGTNDKIAELVIQGNQNKNLERKIENESGTVKIEEKKDANKSGVEKKKAFTEMTNNKENEEIVLNNIQKDVHSEISLDNKNIEKKEDKVGVKKSAKQLIDSAQNKQGKQVKDEKSIKVEEEYSLERRAREMVEGYPIEKMLPYILQQDPEVAKYLIAIAKQESQWGKRVPVLNGQDCYNYWGYRGKRRLMGSGGHTCFNSRKDAVETVGKRVHELIYKYNRTTAKRLIVWKCGSTCAGHSQAGVDRWIGTVDSYYTRLSK